MMKTNKKATTAFGLTPKKLSALKCWKCRWLRCARNSCSYSYIILLMLAIIVLSRNYIEVQRKMLCIRQNHKGYTKFDFPNSRSSMVSNSEDASLKTEGPCRSAIKILVQEKPPIFNSRTGEYEVPPLNENVRFQKIFFDLQNSFYQHDAVCLHVIIHNGDPKIKRRTQMNLENHEWSMGGVQVSYTPYRNDLEIMRHMWKDEESQHEFIVIIDLHFPDILFEKNWYTTTKQMAAVYSTCSNVIGQSMKEPAEIPKLASQKDFSPIVPLLWQGGMEEGVLVLTNFYFWKFFNRWAESERMNWYLWPMSHNTRTRFDTRWEHFNGTNVAPWRMWLARFSAIYNVYTVYFPKTNLNSKVNVKKVCGNIRTANMDGSLKHNRNVSTSRIPHDTIHTIFEYSRRHGNKISLTVVNEAFLETAKSWLCNVDTGGFRPPGLVWVAMDDQAYKELKRIVGSYTVRLDNSKGRNDGVIFGKAGYWRLMLERVYLIRDLLDKGVTVLLFETDQVWLRDPLPHIETLLGSQGEVDLVATIDAQRQLAGNFLFFSSTLPMRKAYREVCLRFEIAYRKYQNSGRMKDNSLETIISNDQSLLSQVVLHDQEFRRRCPVTLRILDQEKFACGRWYKSTLIPGTGPYNTSRSRSPTIINNNYIKGTLLKKKRLIRFGHWFISRRVCNASAVLQAIDQNEARFEGPRMAGGISKPNKKLLYPRVLRGEDVPANASLAIAAILDEIQGFQ